MKALVTCLALCLVLTACGKPDWKSADTIQVNGVRLDRDFKKNGVLHLGLSAKGKDGKDILVKEESKDFKDIKVQLRSAPEAGSNNRFSSKKEIGVRLEVVVGIPGKGDLPIFSNILVDNSGSNNTTDPKWIRVDGAVRGVKSFCSHPSSRVYVGLFGDGPSNTFESTRIEAADANATGPKALLKSCADRQEVDKLVAALGQMKTRGAGDRGTPLYGSLRENIKFLQASDKEIGKSEKVILLTSDGQPTDSTERTADYHTFVEQSGVTVFTVGYGPSAPVTVDGKRSASLDPAAVTVLQEIAQWSNGYYLPLTQTSELEKHIDGLTNALNNGYISVRMVVDVKNLVSMDVVTGTIDVSGKTATFSFLTPP